MSDMNKETVDTATDTTVDTASSPVDEAATTVVDEAVNVDPPETDTLASEVRPNVDPPQNAEAVVEEPQPIASPADETPAPEEPTPISAVSDENPAEASERLSIFQRIHHIIKSALFVKICSISMFCMKLILPCLCLLQMVLWGFSVKNHYKEFWNAMALLDVVNIVMLSMMLIFVIALLAHVIRDIVRTLKRQEELQFQTASTYVAFYLFRMFAIKLFDGKTLLVAHFSFSPIITIVTILILLYAIVRLFSEDVRLRWCAVTFAAVAIILVSVMELCQIGNFASFTLGSTKVTLSDLNIVRYGQALASTAAPETSEDMMVFLSENLQISRKFDEMILVVFLQFVAVFAANVLPFAALSLIGYLMFGLISKNYVQYAKLYACRQVTIFMLISACASVAATVGMLFLFNGRGTGLTVHLNYQNMIFTVVSCVVLLVLLSIPWRVYNVIYKRRYAFYQKSEGGGV